MYVEIIEVDCTEPIHYFKTYYGRVDAVNSILAIGGMDRKSRRKTFRVPTIPQNDHMFLNEYGLARIDRLVFYNAYAIWREAHGNQGINLQDSRYGFRAASLVCVREFAWRAMCECIPKKSSKPRITSKARYSNRSFQNFILISNFTAIYFKYLRYTLPIVYMRVTFMLTSVELESIPVLESEVRAGHHDYERTGQSLNIRGRCISPDCKRKPFSICIGCTRDTDGFVFVCKPSDDRQCWEKLHLARAPHPVDGDGNPIPRPKLTKKRRRNSILGNVRPDKAAKRPLVLNPNRI